MTAQQTNRPFRTFFRNAMQAGVNIFNTGRTGAMGREQYVAMRAQQIHDQLIKEAPYDAQRDVANLTAATARYKNATDAYHQVISDQNTAIKDRNELTKDTYSTAINAQSGILTAKVGELNNALEAGKAIANFTHDMNQLGLDQWKAQVNAFTNSVEAYAKAQNADTYRQLQESLTGLKKQHLSVDQANAIARLLGSVNLGMDKDMQGQQTQQIAPVLKGLGAGEAAAGDTTVPGEGEQPSQDSMMEEMGKLQQMGFSRADAIKMMKAKYAQ